MVVFFKSAGIRSRRRWLMVASGVAGLILAHFVAMAQMPAQGQTTGTASDVLAINNSLTAERLLLQFYNQNISKSYLGAVVNPPTDTTTGTTADTTTGTTTATTTGTTADTTTGTTAGTTTGTTTPPATGPVSLSATLSGGEETPPVTTSASGTATFNFNDDRTQLAYDVQVTGLSGPSNGMHLHRGARGVAGDIIYPLDTPNAEGKAAGSVAIKSEDVTSILEGGFYINVHTAANPNGEIRGQVLVATQATTTGTTDGATTGTTTGATTGTTGTTGATGSVGVLRAMATEFQQDHQEAVAALEQGLGANAQPAPTFRNASLDAPDLTRFLEMAITLESFAVSVHQQAILTGFNSLSGTTGTTTGTTTAATTGTTADTTTGTTTAATTGTTADTTTGTTADTTTGTTAGTTTGTTTGTTGGTSPMNQNAISTLLGIALVDSHHVGALRAFRLIVPVAEGGVGTGVTFPITEGAALPVARTPQQITEFLQPFLDTGTTTGTTTADTTTGTTADTTTGTTTAATTGTTADTTTGTTTGTTAGTTGGTTAGTTGGTTAGTTGGTTGGTTA